MNAHQLTELVRLLEQRGHIFPTDPTAITHQLRATQGDISEKLHRRATLIDRDHVLADRLQQHARQLHGVYYLALLVWAILGFVATYGLMQQSAVNFFVLLLGVLGVNSVMLLIWLMNMVSRRKLPTLPFLWHNSDPIQQAIWQLYTESSTHAQWRKSMLMHQLALVGLLGMLLAALLRLLFRQYRFTWESTLLSDGTFQKMIAILSWLPEKLGFDIPQQTAVLMSRNHLDSQNAAAWGSLLLGSILCYGVLPRVLAWAISWWQTHRHSPVLDLNLPYYQNITQKWQRRIIDSDADYRPDNIRPSSQVAIQKNGKHWAMALDVSPPSDQWHETLLGQEWLDKGVIASREEWSDLSYQINQLDGQQIQWLVAVRAQQTPDRGAIRRLASLGANHLILYLWANDNDEMDSGSLKISVQQWQEIAIQYGWDCVVAE